MIEGATTSSELEFRIQSHELKPDKIYNSSNNNVSNNVLIDGTFLMHVTNDSLPDELYASDYSQDKDEESIIWKGALVSNKLDDCCTIERTGFDDCYLSDYEQEALRMQKNDRIAWWANTWPNGTGLEGEDRLDSLSSLQTDSDGQMDAGSPLWSERGRCKSFEQKVNLQRPVSDTRLCSMDSTQSLSIDKETVPSWDNDIHSKVYEGRKNLMEFDIPHCQRNFEFFSQEANVLQGGHVPTSMQHTDSIRCCVKDDEYNGFSCLSPSQARDFAIREGFLERSRYIIDTEDLDRMVSEAECHKDNMKNGMEEIYLLRQRVEQEELAAQQAKAGATHVANELFQKVEDLRQQTLQKRAHYNMQAAEIYGERSVLSMEARELRLRLSATQAEQTRAMSLLDSVRCTLAERLHKASQEKDIALEEAKLREVSAKQLLAYEEDSGRMLAEDLKTLETEAETCKKLREYLIQRGNTIDSLQGEMLVLCEDILNLKNQVDEGIPFSASRCLSWSHLSHLTQQCVSTSPSIHTNKSRTSNLIETLSSTLTLSSAISGPPSSLVLKDCTLQSQYFSSNTVPIETLDVADENDMLDENTEGLTITACSCGDDGQSLQQSPGDLNTSSTVVPTTALASPKKDVPSFQ